MCMHNSQEIQTDLQIGRIMQMGLHVPNSSHTQTQDRLNCLCSQQYRLLMSNQTKNKACDG